MTPRNSASAAPDLRLEINHRKLFDALPGPYIMFAADTPLFTIIGQNQAHADLSLVQRGAVIGQPVLEAYPDTSEKYRTTGVSDLIESLKRVVDSGQPDTMSTFRYDLKDASGTFVERHFQVTHYPWFDEADSGRVVAVIQATSDVTEAMTSGRKLRQTEQQLAEALAIARVGTWIWEIKHDRVVADANLARMFGVSPQEAAAGLSIETFTEAIHAEDRARVGQEIRQAIDDQSFYESEYRTIDAGGQVHWLLARGRIETDDDGQAARFPGVLLDITERRHLEDELRFANRDLEQRVHERTKALEQLNSELNRSNQELQDFAYVASHDLQEPLRKIQAFGNLMEQEYGPALGDGSDYLKRMQAAAARMSSLITDLLSFSRVTTKIETFRPVDLGLITREVLDDLETRVEDTKGVVEVGALPVIEADPLQMRQLLQNLIGNALKFHKPGQPPQISITARSARLHGRPAVRLAVKDDGVGFDTKYAEKIFAVFQRLHGRDSYEGTGIGLAVCRKIVERHKGQIRAESQPGHGAVFTVTLPCINGEPTEQTKRADSNSQEDMA